MKMKLMNYIKKYELCYIFYLRQLNYEVDENEINELYKKIIKGNSTIKDCFVNQNIFDEQIKIKEIIDLNFSYFLDVSNVINQGLLNTEAFPYYFIKYTYPNINYLFDFKSDYLLLDQINYYLLVSFKEPIEYCQIIFQLNQNIFFIIVIITLYIWIICLIINLIIFYKVIIQLTEPIKKLQEAIESSSIKDENIFKYEYDEFINDLFLTSKELLIGKIDNNNNEKGLDKFNILSIPKDKQSIDKNLYQKNLIINNDIINKLIKEQENMMDFSKNIKVNEELDDDKEKENEINLKKDKNNNDIKNNNKR